MRAREAKGRAGGIKGGRGREREEGRETEGRREAAREGGTFGRNQNSSPARLCDACSVGSLSLSLSLSL